MIYRNANAQFEWMIVDRFAAKLTLKPVGLYIGATLESASDNILNFNEKPRVGHHQQTRASIIRPDI